jgi:uncharacterized repeat protein (TIGR04076 family)
MKCDILDEIIIQIVSINGNCSFGFKQGESFKISDILPKGLCLFAFHTIYPYYLTLSNKGWFSWVKKDGTVIAQCPNPDGSVEFGIGRKKIDGKPTVYSEVIRTRGNCPKGLKKDDIFSFAEKNFKFCPRAIASMLPYINLISNNDKPKWESKDGTAFIVCPSVNAEVVFKITNVES